MDLKIKLWGTRGSLPTSLQPKDNLENIRQVLNEFVTSEFIDSKDVNHFLASKPIQTFAGYGGATACVEVQSLNTHQSIILDGGSGIKSLGDQLLIDGQFGQGKGVAHIFITHFHWDHLIGLPFFVPLFIPGNEIHFYAVQSDLEENIKEIFKKPNFPVSFNSLASNIHFHILEPRKEIQISDIKITPYLLDHPDPCWGYRIQVKDKVYAHCVDTEGTRISQASLGPDLPFYQNVDLMCFDAQYSLHDLTNKIDWGHSAAQIGLDLAMREKVKKIIFVHHDPAATTFQIEELAAKIQEYYEWKLDHAKESKVPVYSTEWSFGFDGQEFNL